MQSYDLKEQIGRGSFGTCHLAWHRAERRMYVAKRIPVHQMAEREEALREAQLLSALRHPNIIAYKESFIEDADKTLVIVTAYAEEGDLFTHIKRARESGRRFSERQLLDWVTQIALALDHIHALRVMHRDLKTQNIFLGRGGVVKLGDFGISKVLERTDDFATTVTGTPYYLAPEVCTNQPYTLKSDVWSLGCVAYEIATLRHAFAADSLLSLVYQIVNGTCPPIPTERGYDHRFAGLVSVMLERDARARPTASELLRHPLMQEHLRRMQTEGLGRTMWLRRGRDGTQDETMSGAGRTAVGGAAAAKVSEYGRDAAAAREKSLRNGARHANGVVWEAVSPPKAPPELTPRERMTRRREMAIAERARVLSEAAAGNDTGEAARRRFRSEFHAGAASDATVEKQKPTVSTSGSFLSARDEAEVDALRKSRDAFDGVVGEGYYERIVRPDADADADASPASPESPGTAFRNFAAAVPAEAPPTDRDRDPVHALFGVKHTLPRGARGGGNGKKDPFAMTFGQEPAFSPYKSNAKNDRGGGGGDDDDDDDDGGILLPPPRRRTNGAGASVGAGALRSTHDEDDVAMIGTMRSSVGAVRTSTSSREPSARDPPGRGLSPTREVAEAEVLAALTLEAELDRGAEEEAARVAAAASAHANPVPVPFPRARTPPEMLPPPSTRAVAPSRSFESDATTTTTYPDSYSDDEFEAYDPAEDELERSARREVVMIAAKSLSPETTSSKREGREGTSVASSSSPAATTTSGRRWVENEAFQRSSSGGSPTFSLSTDDDAWSEYGNNTPTTPTTTTRGGSKNASTSSVTTSADNRRAYADANASASSTGSGDGDGDVAARMMAARAKKVARLRAKCEKELGKKRFAAVRSFLKQTRRKQAAAAAAARRAGPLPSGGGAGAGTPRGGNATGPLSEAFIMAKLLSLVGGDKSKLAACFSVDMLCFEERLFLERGGRESDLKFLGAGDQRGTAMCVTS